MRVALSFLTVLGLALFCACTDDVVAPKQIALPDEFWLSDITTAKSIDVGRVHNVAIERMRRRTSLPMGFSYEEYLNQIERSINRALLPYEPSRAITREECEQAILLLQSEVQPYFDLTSQDPNRTDPQVLLDRWLALGVIDEHEHGELVHLLAGEGVQEASSETVRIAQSVFAASTEYWLGAAASDEDPPIKNILSNVSDTLGIIAAYATGSGVVGQALASLAASTLFDMMSTAPGGGATDLPGGITGYGCGWCSLQ